MKGWARVNERVGEGVAYCIVLPIHERLVLYTPGSLSHTEAQNHNSKQSQMGLAFP